MDLRGLEEWGRRSSRKAHPLAVLAAGAGILLALHETSLWLERRSEAVRRQARAIAAQSRDLSQTLGEYQSLQDLKARDVSRLRAGLSKLTESRRNMYEAGLLLQEERRLLEKQWDVLSLYLVLDPASAKLHLMRGEQSLESYPAAYAAPKAFGGEKSLPSGVVQIVSKERFAHPERGKAEETDGRLLWEPPQVGSSIRANALGQHVIFTNSPLILHGPPAKPSDHEAFPHACLGLSRDGARKVYAASSLGTRIALSAPPSRQGRGGRSPF